MRSHDRAILAQNIRTDVSQMFGEPGAPISVSVKSEPLTAPPLCVANAKLSAQLALLHFDDDDASQESGEVVDNANGIDSSDSSHDCDSEPVPADEVAQGLMKSLPFDRLQGESDSDWTKRVKRMAVTAVDTVSRINTAQTVRDCYTSRSMAATAASNLRKPELQSKVSDISDWLRSVETWLRAQHCDLSSPDTVAMVETYLSAATARRWTQRKAVLARDSKPITFAELRNCVLTSPNGMYPANASRTAFIDLKYNAAKSVLDNLTTYRQLYDTMVLTCEHTRICTLQGYELYEHFMHFMHSGVRSIQSSSPVRKALLSLMRMAIVL